MCSINNEDKFVISEKFIKILKDKISKEMKCNDIKSYLGYLNKLGDE